MTKIECRKKFNKILKESNKAMKKRFEYLFSCGGVEPKDYDKDFELPKILFCAALKSEIFQYTPLYGENKKVVANLEHF